jgi:spore coat protein A, manganese oxidase
VTTRRAVLGALGISVLGGASFANLLARPSSSAQTGILVRSMRALPRPYQVPLPIPAVLAPSSTGGDADRYVIRQQAVLQEILPGVRTPVLGYQGTYPGPTLVARSGRRVVVTHVNELGVPTAVHLHGGHTPAVSDGFPTDLVSPSGKRDYEYPTTQRAASLWYHDHRMDHTARQVYLGLAGFHLVHDDEEDRLPLPEGERDVPLMIADRAFGEDASFLYPELPMTMDGGDSVGHPAMGGVLGDVVLVNGAPWPVLDVDAVRYRLRLLNASNARRYRLRLSPGRAPFVQIGSDSGLLDRPVELPTLDLAPAERYDVVVDFSAYPVGSTADLVNDLDDGSAHDVMRFHVARRGSGTPALPARLAEVERLDPSAAVRVRDWRFRRSTSDTGPAWVVNGRGFDPQRIDATPRLGEVEIWRFSTDVRHPVHVHLDPFQVLARNGRPPDPQDAGWKDTVDVPARQIVEVAVRFSDYAGRYLLHCHTLEHEDMGVMAAFRTA